jgi:hypothetical protein
MADCPTKREMKGLDLTQNDDKRKANLYKSNSRLAAIFTIGQLTAQRLGYLEQTKSDEFPFRIVYRALELMKDRYAPRSYSKMRLSQFHSRMLVTNLTLLLLHATNMVLIGVVRIT